MMEIPLTRGFVAIVDDEDYDLIVSQGSWFVDRSTHAWYAMRHVRGRNGTRIRLHNFIMNPPPKTLVDHIDGNTMNNQRINLRIATFSQNMANRRRWGSRTKFRGVYPVSRCSTYSAVITAAGKRIHIGTYPTEEGAAQAYDAAALYHFGEFATLNFPEGKV